MSRKRLALLLLAAYYAGQLSAYWRVMERLDRQPGYRAGGVPWVPSGDVR
jgi:hypothetical protein